MTNVERTIAKRMSEIVAEKLHRIVFYPDMALEYIRLGVMAFGQEALINDFIAWCETEGAKTARNPIGNYVMFIDRRLNPNQPWEVKRQQEKREAAKQWLQSMLQNGPKPSRALLSAASTHTEIKEQTLIRAMEELEQQGITKHYQKERVWIWELVPVEVQAKQHIQAADEML